MNEYRQYLSEITCDDSWDATDELTFVNSKGIEASFQVDGQTVSLTINGKLIYVGPLVEDRSEIAGSLARQV